MPFFYLVPVVEDAEGRAPDLPSGVESCAIYGKYRGKDMALARTLVEVPLDGRREVRLPDQAVMDTISDLGVGLPSRHPLDVWRIRGQ